MHFGRGTSTQEDQTSKQNYNGYLDSRGLSNYKPAQTRVGQCLVGCVDFKKSFNSTIIEQIQTVKTADPIRIVVSRSHLNEETQKYISQFTKHELLQSGSSIKFCMVAEGKADIYPRFAPTSEWDTGAAQAVVEGAGGLVLDKNGKRMIYQKDNILNPHFIVKGQS